MEKNLIVSTTISNSVPMDIRKIKLSNIAPNPNNARKNSANINALSQSIAAIGLHQPIVVRPVGNGKYVVVAGMRRYLACQSLQWDEIECKVIENDEERAEYVSFAENVERKNLSSKEKADKVAELKVRTGFAQSNRAMAKEIGVSEAYIRKLLKIKNLSTDIQEKIDNKELSQNAALKQTRQQNESKKISDAANPINNGCNEPEAADSKTISITDPSTSSVKEFYNSVMKLADMAMQINLDNIDIESIPHKRLVELTSRLGGVVAQLDYINNTVQTVQNSKEDRKRGAPQNSSAPTSTNLPISA